VCLGHLVLSFSHGAPISYCCQKISQKRRTTQEYLTWAILFVHLQELPAEIFKGVHDLATLRVTVEARQSPRTRPAMAPGRFHSLYCLFGVFLSLIPSSLAEVKVRGFPGSGNAAGQLTFPGANRATWNLYIVVRSLVFMLNLLAYVRHITGSSYFCV